MSLTINVNKLTLCHKGSNGTAIATLPDVCKTPSPGGPVPIPYPNIACSKDLAKGTKTIKVDGGMMAANKGSEFSLSTGDEAGTVGGVVSSTFIKEATWLSYSFDVKLEGKNACRLTDKMFMNHGNTVCLAGLLQKLLALGMSLEDACKELMKQIDDLVNKEKPSGEKGGIRGLKQRMEQQVTGKGGPHHSPDRGPQIDFPHGSNSWQRHDREIQNQQKNLERKIKEYDDNCRPKGPPVPDSLREWVKKERPEPRDWRGPSWEVDWTKVGWGVAAVGLSAAAIALLVCPFDGPLGETATGTAAAGAWSKVFGTAALGAL